MSTPDSTARDLAALDLDASGDANPESAIQEAAAPDRAAPVLATTEEISELVQGTSANLDFIILYDNHRWKVHSRLLSSSSKFFESICYGHWRSADRTVVIEDESHLTICRFIMWLYRQTAELDINLKSYFDDEIWTNEDFVNIYIKTILRNAGYTSNEMWQIESEYNEDVDNEEERVSSLYLFADKYNIEGLRLLAIFGLDAFIQEWRWDDRGDSACMILLLRDRFPPHLIELDDILCDSLATAVVNYLLRRGEREIDEDLSELLMKGGKFAMKVLEVQSRRARMAMARARQLELRERDIQEIKSNLVKMLQSTRWSPSSITTTLR